MGAYDEMDVAKAGYLVGIDHDIDTGCAKQAAGIEFGYPVFGYLGDSVSVYSFKKDVSKLVFDADFVSLNSIVVTVNGVASSAVVFATDHDTTAALVVAALNAMTGVEAVLDTADTDNRTFLIRTKGIACVSSAVVTLGASQATATPTATTGMVFLGIAKSEQNDAGLYELNDAVNNVITGKVYGECGTAVNANAVGYVADTGKFANAGVLLPVRFKSTLAAAGIAIVEIQGQLSLGEAEKFV